MKNIPTSKIGISFKLPISFLLKQNKSNYPAVIKKAPENRGLTPYEKYTHHKFTNIFLIVQVLTVEITYINIYKTNKPGGEIPFEALTMKLEPTKKV
jgi:hypothetical protein